MIRANYPVQTSSRPLTERQRGILDAIAAYQAEHGYAPTTRELGELIGAKSGNCVLDHLWALRRKGYVEWEDGKARTLRVVKEVQP